MRLKIKFGPNTAPVQRNVQHIISWLNEVLGIDNKYHKEKNKSYSISEMIGGFRNEDGTKLFPKSGFLCVSSDDMDFIKKIHKDAWNVPFSGGMQVMNISQSIDEIFLNDELNYMRTSLNGLVLYKRNEKGMSRDCTVFTDDEWVETLNESTKRKLHSINPDLDLSDFIIQLSDAEDNKPSKVDFKDFYMYSSRVTLRVYGSVEIKKLLLTYGLGNLTACGFGMIYPTEQRSEYVG